MDARQRSEAIRNLRSAIEVIRRQRYVPSKAQRAVESIHRAINLLEEEQEARG